MPPTSSTQSAEGSDAIRVRSVEPLIEELTGPLTLAVFGAAAAFLPSYSFGPIDNTRTLGVLLLVVSAAGVIVMFLRHFRESSPRRATNRTVEPVIDLVQVPEATHRPRLKARTRTAEESSTEARARVGEPTVV